MIRSGLFRTFLPAAWLLLAGCLHVPEPERPPLPVEIPAEYLAEAEPGARATVDPEPWWRGFDAPGLAEAVETALRENPEIEAIAARIEQAEAQARIAGAELWPQASAGFEAARRRQNFLGFPIPGSEDEVLSTTTTTLGASLDLSWEIDLWGRIRAARSASGAGYRASVADAAGARLSLSGQTAKTWLAWREAVAQLRVAERTVENREAALAAMERRFTAGLVPAVELRAARTELASAKAEHAGRARAETAASRALQALVGAYPDGSPAPAIAGDPARELLPELPPSPPAGLPAELLLRRPDLLAAEERLIAAGYRIHEAEAARLPALRLTGSGGRASTELEDLLDSDFTVWSLAGGLLQPIFQGGRLEANVELAEARRREAAASWARAVVRALAEVETALAAEEDLETRVATLEEALAEAAATADLARRRHLQGLGDYLARLEAERVLARTETELVAARRARLENRVDLHMALGGDFREPGEPAATTNPSPTEQETGS